ncbi:TPA: type III secretion system effector VopZ [Vibrio parahaemolyticus]|nr:type III secretion system effector VopZ [Vibrio parahaemolyticus]ELA7420519.1 type III secretion system effector VopZ [Vibrio parahaemolyticus]
MSNINNSVSLFIRDTVDSEFDKATSKQSNTDDDFSKILNQMSKVESRDIDRSFVLDQEEEDEECDTELLENTRSIESVKERGLLNFLFRHPTKNAYIRPTNKKRDIEQNEIVLTLQYQQSNYNFKWRKIEIEGGKVRLEKNTPGFRVFNSLHFDNNNFVSIIDEKIYSKNNEFAYLSSDFKKYINVENYTRSIAIPLASTMSFELSVNYFNQINTLNKYRVLYKKKYYIFEFENGKLVNFMRGYNDGY